MLIAVVFLTACNDLKTTDDSKKDPSNTTEDIFKSSTPNAKDIVWEQDGEHTEVEFTENGIEKSILYDSDNNVIQTETAINIDQLPEVVISYISENYAGSEIEEAESLENPEGSFFEVEIETANDEEIELLFSNDGNFIKEVIESDEEDEGEEDDDGEENEVKVDPGDLPAAILEYISQNYGDYSLTEAEKETNKEGIFYEVEITSPDNKEVDLIFEENGTFIGLEEEN